MTDTAVVRFTLSQQAALARLAYCLEQPNAVALLCGPAGVGKSLVLAAVAKTPQLTARGAAVIPFPAWKDGSGAARPPAVLLLDDAETARDGEIKAAVDRFFKVRPEGAVALAGEGRLLSLVARDRRLEQMVSLRGVIPPFTLDETRMLVAARLAAAGSLDERDEVARTIHEIAAGIPAAVTRIADLAAVVVEASPGRTLAPDDIEALHRRLSLQAA
jgi:ATP/maltotriose-dependent transcriptional regulator MalT